MLFFSCQEVHFPKVTHTVSNRSIEAMAMNHFKADLRKIPLNLQHYGNTCLLYLSISFIFFFRCLCTVIETLQKNTSIIIGKNFQLRSIQSKGFPQLMQSTTAISRALITDMQFRESEVEKKYCEVKSQWHSYGSTLSYVDSVKNSLLNFPCHSNPLLLLTPEGTWCALFFLQT